jgi:hypothetical protein
MLSFLVRLMLVASACGFVPQQRAPLGGAAVARSSRPVPIAMAGWNDPYDGGRSERGELKLAKTSFDDKMAVRASRGAARQGCPPLHTSASRSHTRRARLPLPAQCCSLTHCACLLACRSQEDQEKMTNMMLGGTVVMVVGVAAVLIPLLASQP